MEMDTSIRESLEFADIYKHTHRMSGKNMYMQKHIGKWMWLNMSIEHTIRNRWIIKLQEQINSLNIITYYYYYYDEVQRS